MAAARVLRRRRRCGCESRPLTTVAECSPLPRRVVACAVSRLAETAGPAGRAGQANLPVALPLRGESAYKGSTTPDPHMRPVPTRRPTLLEGSRTRGSRGDVCETARLVAGASCVSDGAFSRRRRSHAITLARDRPRIRASGSPSRLTLGSCRNILQQDQLDVAEVSRDASVATWPPQHPPPPLRHRWRPPRASSSAARTAPVCAARPAE